MKKVLSLFFIGFLCFQGNLFAQTGSEVISKVAKQASAATYLSHSITYNLYKDSETAKIHESYKGIYKKNPANSVYQKIKNTEFVLQSNLLLKVAHEDKTMLLSKASTTEILDISIKTFLDHCTISSFKSLKNEWQLLLVPKPEAGLPYSKILVHIGKDYKIKKQKFYYNTGIDFAESFNKQDLSFPVLEIIHSDYSSSKVNDSFFSMKKFVGFKGKKALPTAAYSKYILEDYR